jgi:hypothetical protein
MTTVSRPGEEQVGSGLITVPAADAPAADAPAAGAPAAGGPGGRRDLLAWPAVQGLLALVLYVVVYGATAARSLIVHMSSAQLDQASPDPNFYAWCLRWWPHAIAHGLNPVYTHYVGAPGGYSLAWVTTAPPLAVLAAPVTVAAGPVAAFNLLTALGPPLAGWAAFVLCRRLTGRFWPALVGGAVFGFSAYEMNHGSAGQLNLIYSLLLPVLAYLIVAWRDQAISGRTFVVLAGLVMAVQFYLFLETFADLTAVLAAALLVGLVVAGRAGRPQLLRLARLLGLGYAIALILAAPYLGYVLTNRPPSVTAITGMDLVSIVVPGSGSTFGAGWLAHLATGPIHPSQATYIGIPLLVLMILLAVTRWSSRLVRFLTILLAVIIVAALGSVVYADGHRLFSLPWSGLFGLPIVRNAYPLRLMLFAFLVLAVAAAVFLAGLDAAARPTSRRTVSVWGRWLLAALIIAGLVEDTPGFAIARQTTVPRFISAGEYRSHLRPGEIAVVVSGVRNAGMLWQAQSGYYWRLAGGFVNAFITRRSDLPKPVQNLVRPTPADVAQFEQYVRTDHVGVILLDAAHDPRWTGIFRQMGLTGQQIGGVLVYPTNGCAGCRPLTAAQMAPHSVPA